MHGLRSIYKSLDLGRLLYADKGIIVVNKASGLVCQSDKDGIRDNKPNDFDQLLLRLKAQLQLPNKPIQVHRLDKLTTGALLLARTPSHARDLHQQLDRHDVHKTYLALVRGGEKTFEKLGKQGVVQRKIRVSEGGSVLDERNGVEAVTEWEVLGSSSKAPLSLLRLRPLTGRKRQLRLHLSHVLHCPILGDPLFTSSPPHASILEMIPRGINVEGPMRIDYGKEKRMQEMRLTKRERKVLASEEKRKAAFAQRAMTMFLHSSHVSLYRYTPSPSSRRIRLGVTAPLPPAFIQLCEAADLRQYVPEECVAGGLSIDGNAVDVHKGGATEVEELGGSWYGVQEENG